MNDRITSIARPQHWDVPFGHAMAEVDVRHLLTLRPFNAFNLGRFPTNIPLEGILLNDARIQRFDRGDIVVREGDYGNSAFLILSGAVRVILDSLPPNLLGRRVPARKSFFASLAQLWKRPFYPEVRGQPRPRDQGKTPGAGVGAREEDEHIRIFLQDVPRVLEQNHTARLEAGELFGEIAALSRTPRTATVIADEPLEVLEIRWQGLREIRRYAPEWKEHMDRLYRERSLFAHLREMPHLQNLSDDALQTIADHTRFESFGNYEWNNAYRVLHKAAPQVRLQEEPVIVREGDYPNHLILIRGGFARVSRKYNNGEQTARYLGKGQMFGLEELLCQSPEGRPAGLLHSLRAIGHVDVLLIPAPIVAQYVEPGIGTAEMARLRQSYAEQRATSETAVETELGPDMLEFLVENRYINGTATMLIDLERCTRCDDCVRACAATHDNNPRFIRHGRTFDGVMVANACMHCVDPVCMIGCPTGAIHRQSIGGQVVINDLTCIGCSTCANSCPYENIQMVEIRDRGGNFYVDSETRAPILKATKCDLCADQLGGPACVRACPHDALIRADMREVEQLTEWLNR